MLGILCQSFPINKVTNFDAIKLGGRCEIRTHGPFLIDDFQGRCIKPLCQSSVLWWNVLDSNQLTHYRSRFYRPLQSPMLLTFQCGLRERVRTFGLLIPNQALYQTELLGESFQIQHKIIIHHITSYVKFYVVPEVGIEPTRHFCPGVLSPMRLPISPFGQFVFHFKFNIRSLYITFRLMSNFYLQHFVLL